MEGQDREVAQAGAEMAASWQLEVQLAIREK
jgi:hypothetical protein